MPNKKTWKRAIITLTILLGAFPLFSAALTLDEIKDKLLGILERVSVLKVEVERAADITVGSGAHPYLPCLSLGRNLRAGMEGEDVQKLQEFLIKAGLLAEGKATGYFGPLTEAAVKKWQSAQGIVASGSAASTGYGVVGPKTRAAVLTICKTQVTEVQSVPARTCPVEPEAPEENACTGTWEKGYDAAGCLTGYQCVEAAVAPALVSSPVATSSLTILSPSYGTLVTGGNTLRISWQSKNVPSYKGVALSIIDVSGNTVGEIARNLAPSGVYLWRVPQGNTDCTEGENAFDCIEKFARCDGNTSVCALEPGLYTIRAALSELESSSEPFQIAGTAITDVLKSLVGAPVLPSPSYNPPASSGGIGSCVHDGQSYDEETTLSVPCEAGKCPSETSGYISGTCKTGRWCIPQTSNCAAAFADIDVGAYSGSGGSGTQSGTGVSCPQEGWRAYLACPYGGCTTGWNICRGGIWILDSVQETVIVGMQGPCESGQVWCSIGTGFGCVAASQCVNGSAL
ncbi:peptidoglycan-binding protein [Candidatus Kaiserbacteria bacterium]|nr:peptidoglycan-binding protein [Candidatus Kaiserbacteria bacterium]